MTRVLVTGAAGFIGFHLSTRLLALGHEVVGVDNLNAYYDPTLKQARLDQLLPQPGFSFVRLDLADRDAVAALFAGVRPELVVHLAAQAGVRFSLENPFAYTDSNITGTLTVLEGCRHNGVKHLVYASSSSVYGANRDLPFATSDRADSPMSMYAATKRANELMAYTYSHLFGLPTTGLRFFTVYGPWGRPDMSMFLFTKAILAGEPITVFNRGQMSRDFTFVGDVVNVLERVVESSPPTARDGEGASPPCRVYNVGNNSPVALLDMIAAIERAVGVPAKKIFEGMQAGDVPATYANVDDLVRDYDYKPSTTIDDGVRRFVEWYRTYFKV